MNNRSPYPSLPRPYYKGHNREQDEKLAEELFYGTMVRDKKTGSDCHYYFSEGSPQERQALDALQRLLNFSDLAPGVLAGLSCSLDLDGSFGRRLIFKSRKRKRRADAATDLQIALYVYARRLDGSSTKSAVMDAMGEFGLSRKAIFAARKRVRLENPELKV
jgi:hypothetical protein